MTTYYNTQDQMERKLSAAGVVAFADHDDDGVAEATVIDDCRAHAKGEIDLYCRGRYSEAGLAGSDLVSRWANILSCCYLCEERGNPVPESLQREATRILEVLLPAVHAGTLTLPGVAFGTDLRPAFSNLTIDRRYRRSQIRVTQINSSNQTSLLPRNYADQTIPYG